MYGDTHNVKADVYELPFRKRNSYKWQSEYRFAFILPSTFDLETLIFYVNDPGKYIDKIYLNQVSKRETKERILIKAVSSNLANKIINYDQILKQIQK